MGHPADCLLHATLSHTIVSTMRRVTGYSVYSVAAAERRKHNTLGDLYPPLPSGSFAVIYADPPWDYGGKLQFDKSSKSADRVDVRKNIFISAASFQYPTLRFEELAKLQLLGIAQDDALLFMWATSPHLHQAISLGETWGFKYRTVAFVWDKMVHNPGKYTLSNCELCLVFKRGRIPSPRGARNIQQLVRVPRGKHSEKPTAVRDAITAMFPEQQKLELFARHQCSGWRAWGMDSHEEDARGQPSVALPESALQQKMF